VVKAKPNNARAIFLRGRAREMLDRTKEALADYELASRTAFANVGEPFESGHAHYYRGVLLFRRKDFSRAESEFASALNFETAESMKTDVEAWRHMAAVASGGCAASAGMLEQTLPGTSRLFPRDEARQLLNSCRS
jgi:tetratricopeptide (TPR) repeat protein